jgi:hypothetical protein
LTFNSTTPLFLLTLLSTSSIPLFDSFPGIFCSFTYSSPFQHPDSPLLAKYTLLKHFDMAAAAHEADFQASATALDDITTAAENHPVPPVEHIHAGMPAKETLAGTRQLTRSSGYA